MKIRSVLLLPATAMIVSFGCNKNDGAAPGSPNEKKWIVTTIAGDGFAHFRDGAALSAGFRAPQDIAVAPDGSLYVADAINHRIRKIAAGTVTSFAGSGIEDTAGGIGIAAGF